MKKIVTLIAFIIACQFAYSQQDVIIMKTGDEIKSKVLEVGSNEIKYKKADNIDGPAYSVAKSDVFMIKYENGTKDVFNNEKAPATAVASADKDKKTSFPHYTNITQFGFAPGVGGFDYSFTYYDPYTGQPFTIEQGIENTLKIVQLTTINAVQINNYFSAGFGLGFHYFYDQGEHAITLPLFLDLRGTILGTQKISPVVFFDIGPSIKIDNADGMDGLIMEPGLGVNIPANGVNFNFSVSYMMQKVSIPQYNFYGQPSEDSITLKYVSINLGFRF
ncbi:MAG: hypothetical protein ABIT08_02600 [Bacteroidia bacterium]